MRASRIFRLARTRRCAMVGGGTRKARAISSVESPQSVRSESATCASGASEAFGLRACHPGARARQASSPGGRLANRREATSSPAERAEDLHFVAGGKRMLQVAHPLPIDEQPDVLPNPVLLVDHAKTDSR